MERQLSGRRGWERILVVALFLASLVAGAGQGQEAGAPFKQENRPANLKALGLEIQKALLAKDVKRAAALTRALLPDEARLRKALREDVPAEVVAQILAFHKGLPVGSEESLARLLAAKPGQSEAQVHGATTEEIRAYAQGSVASEEFPQATQKLAEKVLRPGLTFYELEFVRPGEDAGMKYHLFYWDGSRWAMLGPIWRALN